ncbi:hypothetical protein ACJMK2_003229 [Sinanodonta woodiana]|uniref:BTB domain-containing protein n=1 Tax=Sinanodonta woodiana TaxID=1069815 RepID=A0ABD3XXN0_SINWO
MFASFMTVVKSEYLISQEIEPDPIPALFQKSELTDITLIVEGKELHFAKYPLMAGSTVFANMIKDSEDKSRLVLLDVPYKDMIMFLFCLHPETLQDITDENLEKVTRIAHRFKHKGILYRCEQYITEKFKQIPESKDRMYPNFFFHLKVADKFEMGKAIEAGVLTERVEKAYYSGNNDRYSKTLGYEVNENFKELSADTKIKILSRRLRSTEKGIRSLSSNALSSNEPSLWRDDIL